MQNQLFYGDNLRILRNEIADESVDLIYLDPPFNSNRSYNVLFQHKSGDEADAQIQAFDDTWTWSQETEQQFDDMIAGSVPFNVADAVSAMRQMLGDSDALAYLVMMTPRLVELHRVLKRTGSLYLHCDPTASHYLKVILDTVFGPEHFGNEIVWSYKYGGRSRKHFGRKHDIILRYTKSTTFTFNSQDPAVRIPHEPESLEQNFRYVDDEGRRYREGTWKSGKKYRYYADEGRLRDDVWSDIGSLHQADKERLGYPTQKPLELLRLIIAASSSEGDVILDPFCGCGTTIDAAQEMQRRWIGIDITYLAIDLIQKRLAATYGDDVRETYELSGVPREVEAAQALFDADAFDFERWAVSLVNGQPNEKQVGDRGSDGVIRFHTDKKTTGRAIVSVKGGKSLNPSMIRDLRGTVESQGAEMGVFICLHKATKGMVDEAAHSGSYTYELSGATFPRLQIITVDELLKGGRPKMPTPIMPYKLAKARSGQTSLDV